MEIKLAAVSVKAESPYYYAVRVDGELVGWTYSHPRVLPRSWSVRRPTTPAGQDEGWPHYFRSRHSAVTWLVNEAGRAS